MPSRRLIAWMVLGALVVLPFPAITIGQRMDPQVNQGKKRPNQDGSPSKQQQKPADPRLALLPNWFKALDKDGDLQITLQEWRNGGQDLSEFRQHDLDDDGFITADEVLQKIRQASDLKLRNGKVVVSGVLTEAAHEVYRGQKSAQIFTVKLEYGIIYQIEHVSKDYQAILLLENAEGNPVKFHGANAIGGKARIAYRVGTAGTYRIVITTQGRPRSGSFTLSVRAEDRSGGPPKGVLPPWFKELDKDGDGQVSLQEWRQAGKDLEEFRLHDIDDNGFITAQEVIRDVVDSTELKLRGGQAEYQGTLEENPDEAYRDKRSYQILTVRLEQGKTYQFDHKSKEYQAFLYLEDAEGNVLKENSSADVGGNSRIVFKAEVTETYRIVATSLGGFRTGAYKVTVRHLDNMGAKVLPTWFKDVDLNNDGQITLHEWRLAGKKMSEFQQQDLDDDGILTKEEVLRFVKLPFDLRFENGFAEVTGTLSDTAEEMYRGKRSYQVLTVRMEQGKTYDIEHASKDYQAFLYLEDADGKVLAENGSINIGGVSRIVYKAEVAGTYRLVATSVGGFRTGGFKVSVSLADRFGGNLAKSLPAWFKQLDQDHDGQISLQEWRTAGKKIAEFRQLDLNDDGFVTAQEVLQIQNRPYELKLENDQAAYSGEIVESAEEPYRGKSAYKVFIVKLVRGKTYQFDHMSKAFDAYLYLEDSSGAVLAENDDGGQNLNSRIIHRAASTGTYRLIATSVAQSRPGPFTITAQVIGDVGGVAKKRLPPWFNALDKDGDGQITLEEWKKGGKKASEFRKYDLNDDGLISAHEVAGGLGRVPELRLQNGEIEYTSALVDGGEEQYRGKRAFQIVSVKLEQGKTYQIDHISKNYQAFIYLEDADGKVLMEHASSGVGQLSSIVLRADRAGVYRIVATSVGGFRTGEFLLSVRLGGNTGKGVPAWFRQLDTDGDGQVSLQEWRAGGRRLADFAQYDFNDDGFITREEVLRFVKNK